ncbi:MAG: hypothetical protein GF346_09125 [Candidatus Eisenbacteria bacterium]|nr:hypothetical protein [Candidatus Latescibacterota bacterium]MBD3302595.1 hypothetical protein [Candidatus Eisenbacteria bacterium]
MTKRPAAPLLAAFLWVLSLGVSGAETPRFGGELRLRGEGFDNLLDLCDCAHDSYEFYRFRTRFWVEADPTERLRIHIGLGNEQRWGRGPNGSGLRDPEGKIALEAGWAVLRGPEGSGVSLKIGRQNLMFGEGFLVFDGTPADGSGSAYFDAIRLMWEGHGFSADLLTAKLDDEAFGTEARDEDLYALFGRREAIEAYLLHRDQRGETRRAGGAVHPKQHTTALGGRFAHNPETGMHLIGEGAIQTGERGEVDRAAQGGYLRWGWTAPWRLRPAVEIGTLYLSGDDPGTEDYEGWDGFYSEWPKYSELLVYTLYDNTTRIAGDAPGTWTNLRGSWLELRVRPARRVAASVRATRFLAVEKTGPGDGDVRGNLLAVRCDVALMEKVVGQVVGELFDPGDFYADGSDAAWYGRWQITTRF